MHESWRRHWRKIRRCHGSHYERMLIVLLTGAFIAPEAAAQSLSDNQLGVWESHKWYIIGGVSVIIAEALLIFQMLWLRAKRRKTEIELVIANDRLRVAMESGRSVGWDWDVKSGRDHWFGDLQTMFGIESQTYDGLVEDFHQRVHPDDRELVGKAIGDARQNRLPYSADFRVVRADGAVRWITARGKFYYSDAGEAVRMLGIAVDITEQKQAEAALRESEERFRIFANTAPVMIWVSDVDNLGTYFNQSWLEFTGRPLEAELREGWTEVIHPEDRKRVVDTCERSSWRREAFQMELRLRRRDGEYRWVLYSGAPRFNPDRSFAGFIGSALDVTALKSAEEALSMVSRRLMEAHEEERAWLARELHDDISQRLAVLVVNLEGLTKGDQNSLADVRKVIGKVIDEAADLSRDMRGLSHRLHSSKLDHLGLAMAATGFCSELADQHNVKIEIETENIPRGMPKEISLCLFRVLQEALQNAIKHSGSQKFRVSLRGGSSEIRLTVHDSGVGFDPAETLKGGGIGLTSMRERLKLVAGELSIESKPQGGTTVHVRVPLTSAAVSAGGSEQ